MAKYGVPKYGAALYGNQVSVGGGSITITGLIARTKVTVVAVGLGAVNNLMSLKKIIYKNPSGSIAISGSIKKLIFIKCLSSINSFGGAVRNFFITTSGVMAISSTIKKRIQKSFGGSINIQHTITKLIKKNIAGVLSIQGILKKMIARRLTATMSISQSVKKRITKKSGGGSITIIGAIAKIKYFFLVTLDGFLKPLGLRVIGDSKVDILPSTRESTEEVPGRDGKLYFGSDWDSREIDLHVITPDGLTPQEKEETKRKIAKYLDPKNGEKELVFEASPDRVYNVLFSGKITPTNYATFLEFNIPLVMNDPFIYGASENVLVGNGSLLNTGSEEAGLEIKITGPITNPSLSIGSQTVSYTGTIASGQTLVIDTFYMTAKIGTTNALANYNQVFPMLQPDILTAVTAGSNVTIKWRKKEI